MSESGLVSRASPVQTAMRNCTSLHSAGADVIATDVGWLTSRAHLGERHADASSAEIHCQRKPDWTTPDDQDLRVDATRHGRHVDEQYQGAWTYLHRRQLQLLAFADRRSSRIAQLLAAKRTNRQPAGAPALTGNPTVLSVLRLEACHEHFAHRRQGGARRRHHARLRFIAAPSSIPHPRSGARAGSYVPCSRRTQRLLPFA